MYSSEAQFAYEQAHEDVHRSARECPVMSSWVCSASRVREQATWNIKTQQMALRAKIRNTGFVRHRWVMKLVEYNFSECELVTACRSRQSSVIELDEIWRLSSEPLPWQVGSGRSNVSFRDFFGFFSEVFGICSEFFRIKPLLSHPDYRIYQTSVFGIFSDFFRKFSESQNRRVRPTKSNVDN